MKIPKSIMKVLSKSWKPKVEGLKKFKQALGELSSAQQMEIYLLEAETKRAL